MRRFSELLHAVPREGKPAALRTELMRLLDRFGFREQIAELARNREYHESLYSRTITPKAFRRFDVCPEFRTIGKILLGYTPAPTAAC